MANNKSKKGKLVKQLKGLTINHILQGSDNSLGMYGLFKGKELIETSSMPITLEHIANGIINREYGYKKYWCPNCK